MIRAAALLVAIAAPVAAQEAPQIVCLARADMGAQLLEGYSEALIGRFLTAGDQTLVEVFTAPGSWTITVTKTDGQSCIIAFGAAWVMQGVPQGEPG